MDNNITDTSKLTDYCCVDSKFNSAIGHIDFTKRNELLSQLRDLKDKSNGETKCTICKAIQELEGPKTELHNSNNFDWFWFMMLMIIMSNPNFSDSSDTFNSFVQACAEMYGKEKENNTGDLSSEAE